MHAKKCLAGIATEGGRVQSLRDAINSAKRSDRQRTRVLLKQYVEDDTMFHQSSTYSKEYHRAICSCDGRDRMRSLGWWMDAHVGQPWDLVRSKLCRLTGKNVVDRRLRTMMLDMVIECHTSAEYYASYRVDEDGILCHEDDFERPDRSWTQKPGTRPSTWPRPTHARANSICWSESYLDTNPQGWMIINVDGEPCWVYAYAWWRVKTEDGKIIPYPIAFRRERMLTPEETEYLRTRSLGTYRQLFLKSAIDRRNRTNECRLRDGLEPLPEIVLDPPFE